RTERASHVDLRGGRFTGPGHPDNGNGFSYGEGYGVFIDGGSDITIEDAVFTGFSAGLVLNRVDGFRISNINSTAMRSDGVDAAESRNGVIEGVQCSGTRIRDKEHPDCIQLWSRKTSPPTADIVIRR